MPRMAGMFRCLNRCVNGKLKLNSKFKVKKEEENGKKSDKSDRRQVG